jgi:SAM-dependent methyltransferase
MSDARAAGGRGRPRLWHHDYLHLRPLARDLRDRLSRLPPGSRAILDLGSGGSPYRDAAREGADWIRVDVAAAASPDVVARAERLPFADGTFDAALSTQVLGLVDDPWATARELARVLRPGGTVWITAPAAWPYDSARVEHRFGEPQLRALFSGLNVREVIRQGGMLALPFALANVFFREAAIAAERRVGPAALPLRALASSIFVLSNLAGRALEILAASGPFSVFLGYLDRRMPMNFLVVAEKPR